MKQENKMTKRVLGQLKTYNIKEDDILLHSPIDLSFEGEYIRGYAFITKDKLGICTMTLPKDSIKYFK